MAVSLGPRKMTKDCVDRILYAIDHGMPRSRSARYGGIWEATFDHWVDEGRLGRERGVDNEYTRFLDQVEKHETDYAIRHTDNIDRLSTRSWLASAWILERRFPQDFGPRQVLEVSGPEGGPIVTMDDAALKTLSTDELLVLEAALRKVKQGATNGQSALGTGSTIDGVSTQARSDPS